MKICLFADAESIHTIRWCNYFVDLGHEVHLISFKKSKLTNVTNHFVSSGKINVKGGNWKVLLNFKKVKAILRDINPDIFHAHYATSYGITGALCNFHPFVVTALGTDVLISPDQSKILKYLLKWALKKADWITSMADHMTVKIHELIGNSNKVMTLPFGIDTNVFYENSNRSLLSDEFVIISTRNFEPIYNIPHLILAYKQIVHLIPNSKLILIGAGSLQNELVQLISDLGLTNNVEFKGKIAQTEIASFLNSSHVFVSVSKSDGNNISLNEAMACGTICIATSIPANVQWIKNGENGFLVSIDDVDDLAAKILDSFKNFDSYQPKFNELNQLIIAEKADWKKNMSDVILNYKRLISNQKK